MNPIAIGVLCYLLAGIASAALVMKVSEGPVPAGWKDLAIMAMWVTLWPALWLASLVNALRGR